jgi:hypothetical protein
VATQSPREEGMRRVAQHCMHERGGGSRARHAVANAREWQAQQARQAVGDDDGADLGGCRRGHSLGWDDDAGLAMVTRMHRLQASRIRGGRHRPSP